MSSKTIFDNNEKREMIKPTDKCMCGHIVRDHTVRIKKRLMNSWVTSECNLCNCEEVNVE